MSPEEIKIVLGRLGSLEASVTRRFDKLEGRLGEIEALVDSGFVTQGEQIKELSGNFEKLIHVVNDRFDKLDRERV